MHGSAQWLPALALLDTGSQRTFCKATLFERLGTPVVEGELSLGVVGQDCTAMSIREGDLYVRAAGVETPVHEMGGVCGVKTLPLDESLPDQGRRLVVRPSCGPSGTGRWEYVGGDTHWSR